MLKKIVDLAKKKAQPREEKFTVLKHLHGNWDKEEVVKIMKIGAGIARCSGFPEYLILLGAYTKKLIIETLGVESCEVKRATCLEGLPFIPAGR
jgi:hypothetical protein